MINLLLLFSLLSSIILVLFFQIFYFIKSFDVRIVTDEAAETSNITDDISIIIPVFGEEWVIEKCLASVLVNSYGHIKTVVVVLDRCPNIIKERVCQFVPKFAIKSIALEICILSEKKPGKVNALLLGSDYVTTRIALLLDSDIILEESAIYSLVKFHIKGDNLFSSCLIYPYSKERLHSLVQRIICNNRLYRQNILQSVKNIYDCANFPGGVQLVYLEEYKKLLVDGFLEDLTATYAVLREGKKIDILNKVLAYEVERETLVGLFLQRVRWTIGALQHVKIQVITAQSRKLFVEKFTINSYHVMWELQYYVIFSSLISIPYFSQIWYILISPFFVYFCTVYRSYWLSRVYYKNSLLAVLLHCFIHPAILTVALPCSFLYLLHKRGFNFETKILFRRL